MIVRVFVSALIACAVASPALADPFVQKAGSGRVIVSTIFTDASRGFNNDGDVSDIPDYDQDQVYVTAEYGVTDDVTAFVAPSLRRVAVEGDRTTTGLNYAEVGLRYRLAHGTNWTVSTQGMIRVPGKRRADRIAQIGNTSTDFDMRVGGAYAEAGHFVTAEGGYRFRSGDLPNEFRLDVGAGTHLTDKVMVVVSSMNTFSDGRGQGVFNQPYRYGDAYASAVFALNERLSLQAGYTATIYGRNALRQRGPVLGIWFNF